MMTTGNPALRTFDQPKRWHELALEKPQARTMTLTGTVVASATLFSICVGSALISWKQIVEPALAAQSFGSLYPWLIGSLIGGLVLSLIALFAQKTAPFVGPLFAAAEGILLATISAVIVQRFLGGQDLGLIFQAITITFGIFAGMLIAYGSGLVKASGIMAKMFMVGAAGLGVYVLAIWIGNGLFGLGIPNLYASASPLGIGFTALCLALASYSLVFDFELVKQGINQQAPKHLEWVAAVGLLASLVWIYIEVLRLLAKLRSGD